MANRVAIGLGSNLGNSREILEKSIGELGRARGILVEKISRYYRTVAIGPPQPDYLNACVILRVDLTPLELLDALLAIERKFGRVRLERWGPRTLDLDLLLYDDFVLETAELEIPHPRFRERAFVLVPLAEIAPDWRDPVSKQTIRELRESVDCSGVSVW
ncbi:2-amino-4-hydroxy-6-hydroxymethyldihydropteridine diphosphokinase [Pannus brasiliensis CCIBt3594]|uniref:2-amino-4-hydroxy-6-hydroxymethyldihydropteridine diphosphokinase n=1 Tax=Pannus brasiliensis CCIBt3594 TaxID=1427578 RepID=A0AAW9QJU9_9CHRO